MVAIEILIGLILLALGGDLLVRGAVTVAQHLRVSPLLIGLTLVGFGTSTPELVTSLEAALRGAPGIAVGNVVGSNIANILLILGLSAAVLPLAVDPKAFRRDGLVLFIAALAAAAVILFGRIDRLSGLLLVTALIVYVVFTFLSERRQPAPAGNVHTLDEASAPRIGLMLAIGLTIIGLVLTIFGARLLVSGAVALASLAGVSETIIGLTIVAVGTSLPELITSIAAALRRQADVAFGNIVGSNIYNIFGILGVSAIVTPIDVPAEIAGFDLWVLLGVTAVLVVFATTGRRVSRWEGAIMLTAYVAYVSALIARS
ncbi:cation:H+ antiporter [Devosia enhydra]|uniref:Cation:H+ antiporter n=1 Tax=Devosia enhydra TaxID=665118 RepID=A0A1K2HTP5_9HYPH|nr:calcium/sodium antiporter [Devosia enhydra]SFZ81670.1 cation:H+ antiporter [Devosia enhydra]